ncbi:Hypothetical protein TGAM_0671 [Thermococcus gammatolerans EJ3]|uniref:Uncharacterized protein n=2 Tax=Thermococcus TaxID=2263 RepID=C5A4L1_THEGJ|nr:Hypothetical protein TGAM_0671 [Thermococcus gammatolerans EJ3]
MGMTRFVSLSEELAVKLEYARAEWEAQKVQILIENDEVPEGHEVALELKDLVSYLESLEIPTRVVIDSEVYKVKLRKKVPYDRYREILAGLNNLSHARWDKKARAILVDRTREMEEQLEVEEIVITPKEVRA